MKKVILARVMIVMIFLLFMASFALAVNSEKEKKLSPATKKIQIKIQVLDSTGNYLKGAKISVADKSEVYEKKIQRIIYGYTSEKDQKAEIKIDKSSNNTDLRGAAIFNFDIIYSPELIFKIRSAKVKKIDLPLDFLVTKNGYAEKKAGISVDVSPALNPQPEPPAPGHNLKTSPYLNPQPEPPIPVTVILNKQTH